MNAAAPSVDLNVANNNDADVFGGEAGIVKALNTVRQAAVSSEIKGKLRNLFLAYVGEGDEGKRSELKAEILAIVEKEPQLSKLVGVQNEQTKPKEEPSVSALGQTRPAPSFAVSPVTPKKEEVSATPAPAPVAAPAPKEPAAPPPTPEPTPTEPVAPTPVPEPPPPAPVPPTPPAPEPAPIASDTNAKARIDAIKHDINGKVGNPVNLINADEAIGREYMSALLGAMKQASLGGGPEALTRLDAAYQAALNLIRDKGLGTSQVEAKPEAKVETPKPETPPPAPPAPEPTPVPEEVKTEPAPPTPAVQSEGLYHRPSDETEEAALPKEEKMSSFASRFFKTDESKEKSPKPEEKKPVEDSAKKVEVNKPKPAPVEPETLKPLKETATALPEKMADLKEAAAKREALAKKPITDLKSPEVEAGLRQLLSEWVLFKKSGFLGTGPSGIDHPLYKKLSGMPMAAVVSGRFEGVTPEIKHHLSDYMTGWRYEQGVMHEMGETFENYLRRVIRQVLEKQRKQAAKE